MENASKALMLGASILLAILIISLATRLFNSAFGVAKRYDDIMQSTEVTNFNSRFTKYMSLSDYTSDADSSHKNEAATIYDIISLANFAYDYNSKMVEDPIHTTVTEDPAIVEIHIEDTSGTLVIPNLQNYCNNYSENSGIFNDLMSKCYYANNAKPRANNIITYSIHIIKNNKAGRINYVTFQPENKGNIDIELNTIKTKYGL